MPDKYGIRVVQPGTDIEAALPNEIDYGSEFQSPKVNKPLRGQFQCDSLGNSRLEIPHGLTYAPGVIAFYRTPSANWRATDNDAIGVQPNRFTVIIRTRLNDQDNQTNPLFKNAIVDYKIYSLLDPAQEII